ncbi:hypothetical protein BC831DRAFT_486725 [Entophlyctis helioformis]|nr:hypothetical protein BC831DRAFT_486725 [Entophlyctis helioformis]
MLLDTMPLEMQQAVYTYLPLRDRLSVWATCRRMRAALTVGASRLWQTVNVHHLARQVARLGRSGRTAGAHAAAGVDQHAATPRRTDPAGDALYMLLPHIGHYIVTCTAGDCLFGDRHLAMLARFSPRLASLDIRGTTVTHHGLIAFLQTLHARNQTLHTVLLGNVSDLTDAVVQAIANGCYQGQAAEPRLTGHMDVAGKPQPAAILQSSAAGPPPPPPPPLRRQPQSVGHVRPESFKPCAAKSTCSGIRSLDLSHTTYSKLTSASLHTIARSCLSLSLTHLSIRGCHAITNDSIQAIARSCTRLESLDCSGVHLITDESVQTLLAERCTTLTTLNVSYCWRLSDAAFEGPAVPLAGHGNSAQGTSLVILHLDACLRLSDAVVAHLLRLPRLGRVTMSDCASVSEAAKQQLRHHGISSA